MSFSARSNSPVDDDERGGEGEADDLLDLEVIAERLELYRSKNELLALENEMFSRYLKRKDKDTTVALREAGEVLGRPSAGTSVGLDSETMSEFSESSSTSNMQPGTAADRKKRQMRQRRKRDAEKYLLPVDVKIEIAREETEERMKELAKDKKRLDLEIEDVKARMVESDIHVSDLRKEALEFRREILLQTEADQQQKHTAEKVIRFFEEKLKHKDALCEKLRLKNQSLKGTQKKLEQQVKQRDDGGETFDKVDFEQLKIEHAQYLEKIEEKNADLLTLKLTTANTVAALNGLKEELGHLVAENAWLQREIAQREHQLERLRAEIDEVTVAREIAQQANERLRNQQEEIRVPEVLDYVQQKAEMYELDKELKNWERKLEIVEGQYKTVRTKALRAEKAAATTAAGKRGQAAAVAASR